MRVTSLMGLSIPAAARDSSPQVREGANPQDHQDAAGLRHPGYLDKSTP
jgi:hypothetical protein